MGDGDVLLIERRGDAAWVTLNRPDRLNAMNVPLMDGLTARLRELAGDVAVRCVALTGAGRSFSVGGDVIEMRERQANTSAAKAMGSLLSNQADALAYRGESSLLLATMPKPTVAVVRGHAIGGAFSLVLACDVRIAARSAKLRLGFPSMGLSGDYGAAYLLREIVGAGKARELLLFDPVISAERAYDMGLVTQVVDDDALDAEAAALAERLATGPTFGFAKLKENLTLSRTIGFAEFLRIEAINTRLTANSRDCKEAATAFAEKRPPLFEGN